jgi:hypothetical protein
MGGRDAVSHPTHSHTPPVPSLHLPTFFDRLPVVQRVALDSPAHLLHGRAWHGGDARRDPGVGLARLGASRGGGPGAGLVLGVVLPLVLVYDPGGGPVCFPRGRAGPGPRRRGACAGQPGTGRRDDEGSGGWRRCFCFCVDGQGEGAGRLGRRGAAAAAAAGCRGPGSLRCERGSSSSCRRGVCVRARSGEGLSRLIPPPRLPSPPPHLRLRRPPRRAASSPPSGPHSAP